MWSDSHVGRNVQNPEVERATGVGMMSAAQHGSINLRSGRRGIGGFGPIAGIA